MYTYPHKNMTTAEKELMCTENHEETLMPKSAAQWFPRLGMKRFPFIAMLSSYLYTFHANTIFPENM